jgi:PAS domain S-box-containing protein
MHDYTREELIGQPLTLFEVAPADPDESRRDGELLAQLAREGRIQSDSLHRRKDGTVLQIESTNTLMVLDGRELVLGIDRDVTARKQAEVALKASEEQFRLLFEHLPDAILLIDPHDPSGLWPIVDCNAVACRMYGYTRDELIDLSVKLLEPPSGKQSFPAALHAMRHTRILRAEVGGQRKDGSVFPVENSSSLVTIAGRELVLGIDRDITERVEVEEERRRSEAYFRALTEHAADVVTVVNRDGAVRYTTSAQERMLGYQPAERIGTHMLSLIHPDDLNKARDLFTTLLDAPGATISAELCTRHRDGRWRVLDCTATNLLDDPDVVGIVINSRDITERKQAEEALRASEARYRTLVEHFPNGAVFLFDHDLRYTVAGGTGLASAGLSPEDVVGKTIHEIFPPEIAARDEPILRAALAGRRHTSRCHSEK